uniref:4Fe-4S ferredoxin-type domain-containing protein n=1 Tax=candidate division WOR-3 bacterium TaxID=2052148 RepID=A0A7C3YSE3_UNCW3
MGLYFLRERDIIPWLSRLEERFAVFLPQGVKEGEETFFAPYDSASFDWRVFQRIRSSNPLKEFFFFSREEVASYFGKKEEENGEKLRLLIGAKACDILPLLVHRHVFLGKTFSDPFFQKRLGKTIILTADCPIPEKTCFCNLVNLSPNGSKEADGNISSLEDGIILETNSNRGEDLIKYGNFISLPESYRIKREEIRKKAEEMLLTFNPNPIPHNLPERVNKGKREFWEEKKKGCVECFGCLFVCPTCFCFLLYDFPENGAYKRVKVWDGCYLASYARVGGGLNARPLFFQRFRNRFHCKFMNTYYDFNFFACSGCGRCFKVCPAKIDIREIIFQV